MKFFRTNNLSDHLDKQGYRRIPKQWAVLFGSVTLSTLLFNNYFNGVFGIRFVDWILAYAVFIFLPVIFCKLSLFYLQRLTGFDEFPAWVTAPLNWVVGVILITACAVIDYLFQWDLRLTIGVALVVLTLFYSFFAIHEKPIWVPRLDNQIYSSKDFLVPVFFSFSVVLFFLFWGSRIGFSSFNPDNMQNVHVANIYRYENVWVLFAQSVSPQYNQVDYTTMIVPLQTIAVWFFDFREVMKMMFPFEVIMTLLVFFQRYWLFKLFKIKTTPAAAFSALSVMFTFGGLYQVGTFYNQSILVNTLPSILYFSYRQKFDWTVFAHIVLLPFHFTMSVFLFAYSALFVFVTYIMKPEVINPQQVSIDFIKFLIVGAYLVLLILESLFTFELNYLVSSTLVNNLSNPQYANTLGFYSNISIIDILIQGLGPFLTGLLTISPIAWLFNRKRVPKWAYWVILGQLLTLIIPFPVAARTFAFMAIPVSLGMYYVLDFILLSKERLISIVSVFLVATYFLWSFSIRTFNLNITGDYMNYAFITDSYLDGLKSGAEVIVDELELQPDQYKIVAEYFTKQHLEVLTYKLDDNGVYEENLRHRAATYEMLNGLRSDSCKYWGREYIVYFFNEKSYKWSRAPRSLALNSTFSIWFSPPTTAIERAEIHNIPVETDGSIIVDDSLDDDHRIVVIDCKDFKTLT